MTQIEKEKMKEVRTVDIQTLNIPSIAKGVEVSVQFKHLEAVKNTQDTRFTTVHYPMSIFLGEAVGSYKGNAVVPFTVEVTTNPKVATFNIKGEAYIKGAPEDIEAWVVPNKEKAPKIWTRIYQESVAMLTIMARFINIPPPPAPVSNEEKRPGEK